MRKFLTRLAIGVVAVSTVIGCAACGESGPSNSNNPSTPKPEKYYDNSKDPVVFSTLEVDKVFNPFFYTSGPDGNVVGLTQLSILSNDKEGNPVCGPNEATIALDYEITNNGKPQNNGLETTYYFVLKNNVRFSDGSYLTMKDVLFNFYVYLDIAYTGSSTIYSTDIKGLAAYRTQERSEKEQKAFMTQFENAASGRITALSNAADAILKKDENQNLTQEQFKEKLQEYAEENTVGNFGHIAEDFDKACELFQEELNQDYSNSVDAWEDTSFKDEKGNVIKPFKTDMEVFLYNENGLSWNKKDGEIECSYVSSLEEARSLTKEQAIQKVYDANIPNNISQVVTGWMTATNLHTYLTNAELEIYSSSLTTKKVPNIEGIQFVNREKSVTVKGKEYGVPAYNADGSVKEGNEVLAITINNVDPKAIWNFALPIAPMSYYSDKEHIDKFDYESNFGVEWGSQSFLQGVVNASDKVGLPMGAGPYAASRSSGGINNVKSTEFYSDGVIYYESNPYYLMGEPLIKKVRYQVVAANQMTNVLYTGNVDFVEPNAKPEIINELNGKKGDGYGNETIYTAGYGYIGINAGKVPSLKVRQAIMHAIDVKECANYYGTEAKPLYRSMSSENWAYPKNATPYYPYIGDPVPALHNKLAPVNPDYVDYVENTLHKKEGDRLTQAEQEDFLRYLITSAGYHEGSSGIYTDDTNVLKYTFTIAGNETDHPAFGALNHAREILNRVGFQINVTTDAQALSKLSSGGLAVWAAAWSSTIDPDMYQVYHKDSKATSTLNWGYREILQNAGNKYSDELKIVNSLSDLIERARTMESHTQRSAIYSQALDLVMQLAVELPTYQRKDLFAYNAKKIDATTFNQDTSSYKGLTSDMHLLSLIVEK